MALRVLVAGLVVAGAVVAITTLGSSPSVDDVLSAHLLTASELPVGWHATPASATTESLVDNRCFKSFPSGSSSQVHSTRTFAQGGGLPFLSDSLARVSSPPRLLDAAATTLSHCSSINIREGSTTLHGTVARLGLAHVGRHSAAFKLVFSVSGFDVTADVVLFTTARDLGEVVYGDSAAPVTGAVTAFARAALSRADGADPVVAAQSITSVPVRLAHTSDGVGVTASSHRAPRSSSSPATAGRWRGGTRDSSTNSPSTTGSSPWTTPASAIRQCRPGS